MPSLPFARQPRLRHLLHCLVITAAVCFLFSRGAAQTPQAQISPEDMKKFSGMFTQLGGLLQKMQAQVEFPAPRNQSRLLPLLPESTLVYMALPNYGEASHQALAVFQQELKDNAQLRAWWQERDMATTGPKIEEALEKFYQLSQYLGDEIVISAASSGKEDPKFLILAEVRKPGLKDFLRQELKDFAGKSKPAGRVFDPAELAAAKNLAVDQPVILVRSDVVVLSENVDTLRKFNALQANPTKDFAATEFGQRLSQGYEGGATVIAGADFRRIFKLSSTTMQNDPSFQRTGLSDMKFLIWEHKNVSGQAVSQAELSFTRPRRGVVSWLAAPGPLGSLDFVSPKALMAVAIHLKNPADIFDEINGLAASSNPNALAPISQMERALNVSLRDDLLGHLDGEVTIEMDSVTPPTPEWKLIFKSPDPAKVSATLSKILTAMHVGAELSEDEGVTYHTVKIPSPQGTAIAYAFVDGYWIVASSRRTLADAIRLHRSGESLAKSQKFLASLPPGNLAEASAVLYEDPIAMAALSMQRASPELAGLFSQITTETSPIVACAYGEESALREASRSGRIDAGAMLIGAAIAIPNLLRARSAANEAGAIGTIRTINTAQVTYSVAYPKRGFARDLGMLGPDPKNDSASTEDHANYIDATLGNESCTAGNWCTKSGFQFSLSAVCKSQRCDEYVAVATPVSASTGSKSFCSTSEAVIRVKTGAPITSPIRASECRRWPPLTP